MTQDFSFLRRILTALMLMVFGFAGVARAQTTQAGIEARLVGKPLFLKGFWRSDKLKFDASGALDGISPTGSFTVSGIEIQQVALEKHKLELLGRRIGVEFPKKSPVRIALSKEPGEQTDEVIKIEIAAPAGGDYNAPLSAIFANGLAELIPVLPEPWQEYANKYFVSSATIRIDGDEPVLPPTGPTERAGTSIRKPGGAVSPPRVLYSKEPKFSEEARLHKFKGSSLLDLIVEADGSVTHVHVVNAVGLGLDEAAISAIEQYKFSPAMEGERPVPVELSIEVDFKIF